MLLTPCNPVYFINQPENYDSEGEGRRSLHLYCGQWVRGPGEESGAQCDPKWRESGWGGHKATVALKISFNVFILTFKLTFLPLNCLDVGLKAAVRREMGTIFRKQLKLYSILSRCRKSNVFKDHQFKMKCFYLDILYLGSQQNIRI